MWGNATRREPAETMGPHWKTLVKLRFARCGKVKQAVRRNHPRRGLGNLTVGRKPLKTLVKSMVFAGVPNSIGWWEIKPARLDGRRTPGAIGNPCKNGRYQVVNRPFAPTELRPAAAAARAPPRAQN